MTLDDKFLDNVSTNLIPGNKLIEQDNISIIVK